MAATVQSELHVSTCVTSTVRKEPLGLAFIALVAILVTGLSLWKLEGARAGIETSDVEIGTTPATFLELPGSDGPLVVVAHGFAGSRQLMDAYSLTLAHAGYAVLAFDFEGHGRNPVPMSGDVTAIDGTTRLLVDETRRVIAAARSRYGAKRGLSLLGHSMATDVLVRAALAEAKEGRAVDAIVGLSMFSQAVTPRVPERLLVINGEWEGRLRESALEQLHEMRPNAREGETVRENGVLRRVVVAPHVEHVGILYSASALGEARDWLDLAFDRDSQGPVVQIGLWILALLFGIVLLFRPLVALLPSLTTALTAAGPAPCSTRRFLLAILVPGLLVPAVATIPPIDFLPVLVADYLMVHLALYGALQLAILQPWKSLRLSVSPWPVMALVIWGIAVFGVALDRYAASFLPNAERLVIILVLCLGTIIFMIADSIVSGAGQGRIWRRLSARVAFIGSLAVAAAIDPERLLFLLLIVPVLLLFFCVHGLMGRWVAQRQGPWSAGLGLGLCLAWALGVSFPLFDAA